MFCRRLKTGAFAKDTVRSLYADRLLISVRMERAKKPSLVVSPSIPVSEPVTIPCVLWADVYEVCFEGSDAPDDVRFLLSLSSKDVLQLVSLACQKIAYPPSSTGILAKVPHRSYEATRLLHKASR